MTPDLKFKAELRERLDALIGMALNGIPIGEEMKLEKDFVNWVMKRYREKHENNKRE